MNPLSKEMSPDEITNVLLSFNDPSLIANVFKHMGWSPTLEITETLKMAKQDNNLNVKLRAIKHLRELMKEAGEASGLIANMSQSRPLPGGGSQTFHAKRIMAAMNPTKKIESTQIGEAENVEEKAEPNRTSNRPESQGIDSAEGNDNPLGGCADAEGDGGPGDSQPEDGGTPCTTESADTPCIKSRKPDCDQSLFPGISESSAGN